MDRKAKIGATLGPSCDDETTLVRMVRAGVDVARLNFSHGRVESHRRRARRLRRAARAAGRRVALMADLQGPRIRVGRFEDGSMELEDGGTVEVRAGAHGAERGVLPVPHGALADHLKKGDRILIDDGKIELVVRRTRGRSIHCDVRRGGVVADRKGINLPGVDLPAPSLTLKDRRDLAQAVELGADWLAVSFVRRPEDVRAARRLVERAGASMAVMAKIERREAIDRLDGILAEADGLLVARGDLGVELPPQDVPILQKQIIEAANREGRVVVTATQMLESMRDSRRPTRAEASDVANAVLDGSDCLLLTAETATGKYPVESVEMMAGIVREVERSGRAPRVDPPREEMSVALTTCLAGCRAAFEVGARYLAVFTQSGFSAQQTARFRPRTPIVAFAASEAVARRLAATWGVTSHVLRPQRSIDGMVRAVGTYLAEEKLATRGERVVILAGSPIGVAGTTNLMEIHTLGRGARGQAATEAARASRKRGRRKRSRTA
jgi:pyruvate kinase